MATLGNNFITLADMYRKQDPDGTVSDIIEMMTDINPILADAMAIECNDGSKHLTKTRTGLPSATWRKLYEGVQPTKSTVKQVYDTTGWMEAYSEIDAKLVALAGANGNALRLDEAEAHIEGMSNQMATALFYSDTASTPEQFMGLAPRFDDLAAENAGQIVDAGGTGADNTSIWFVTWGVNTCHLLYPKGTKAGVQREDLGKTTKEKSDGSMYEVFREHFQWDVGLSLRDWRYVSRVANVDVSQLLTDGTSGTVDINKHMISAYYKLRQRRTATREVSLERGKSIIYCNTVVKEALHKKALDLASGNLSVREIDGEEIVMFSGIPIRECDALINTEARVV
jgi:hypothetical protein